MNTRKNVFLYWRMENGHEHSFLKFNTADILQEFAIENEKGEITQEQYMEYIKEKENTNIEDIEIIDFTELNEEFAQSLLDLDMIVDFEIWDGDVVIEFY